MPINIASFFQPKNATNPDPALRNTYYLLEDSYLKGGYQVRLDHTDRDGINSLNRKAGMLVMTLDDGKIWYLDPDLVTWIELQLGSGGGVGQRTVLGHTTAILDPGDSEDFVLPTPYSFILFGAELSSPGELRIYGLPDHQDTNPYTFVAVTNHLLDDGTYVNGSGTKVDGRRYTTLFNLEEPKVLSTYYTVTNTSDQSLTLDVSISFLPLEF